jgi:hypothetical protein
MDDASLLRELVALAGRLGLAVRELGPGSADEPAPSSALCRVRGRPLVALCPLDPPAERIDLLARALRGHAGSAALDAAYMLPALRERIERGHREGRAGIHPVAREPADA